MTSTIGCEAAGNAVPPLVALRDYVSYLHVKKGRGRSARHISEVERRVSRMLAGANSLRDVTPVFIEQRMRELLSEPVRIKGRVRTRTTTTVDYYRRELGTFFRWARRRGLVAENPVEAVDPYEWADAQEVARPFTHEEAARFFSACSERFLPTYLFWATSGLRPAETRRLLGKHAMLAPSDGSAPYVQLLRASTKNKKAIRQPLHADVVAFLRRTGRGPEDPLFVVPTPIEFVIDLARAGLLDARIGPEGNLTRTSLRKLFATALDREGTSEGLVQKLMRHSTPELTRARYTHYDLREKADAIGRLAFLPPTRRPPGEAA